MPKDLLITEANYEDLVIGLLKEQGYEYTYGPDIPRTSPLYQDVYIADDFLAAVRKINSDLPLKAINEAFTKMKDLSGGNVAELNMEFTKFLQDGVPIHYFDGKEDIDTRVRLLDYGNPRNNIFRVVNQYTFQERETKRPDVVLFVNGMPLVIFELKSPNREETDVSEACLLYTSPSPRDS